MTGLGIAYYCFSGCKLASVAQCGGSVYGLIRTSCGRRCSRDWADVKVLLRHNVSGV
jgi:hypothetical protein